MQIFLMETFLNSFVSDYFSSFNCLHKKKNREKKNSNTYIFRIKCLKQKCNNDLQIAEYEI